LRTCTASWRAFDAMHLNSGVVHMEVTTQERVELAVLDDAVSLLKREHRQIEQNLSRCLEEDAMPAWDRLIKETLIDIKVHMEIEEEIFYPAHLAASRAVERHHDSMVEHESIKKLIADIENSDPGDGHYYEAMIRALWRMLKVHMAEEEAPGGVLGRLQPSALNHQDLAQQLASRRDELKEDLMATPQSGWRIQFR
jgi:hypothetical protein